MQFVCVFVSPRVSSSVETGDLLALDAPLDQGVHVTCSPGVPYLQRQRRTDLVSGRSADESAAKEHARRHLVRRGRTKALS